MAMVTVTVMVMVLMVKQLCQWMLLVVVNWRRDALVLSFHHHH